MSVCQLAPEVAADGDVFTCPSCGVTMTFVVLDDGYSEWVLNG